MPPDTAERRPLHKGGAHNDAAGSVSSRITAEARRCFTWRNYRPCGCLVAADCQLNDPLPVHGPQPCPGEFDGAGRLRPCCGVGAT